jgi:hypothetical protein
MTNQSTRELKPSGFRRWFHCSLLRPEEFWHYVHLTQKHVRAGDVWILSVSIKSQAWQQSSRHIFLPDPGANEGAHLFRTTVKTYCQSLDQCSSSKCELFFHYVSATLRLIFAFHDLCWSDQDPHQRPDSSPLFKELRWSISRVAMLGELSKDLKVSKNKMCLWRPNCKSHIWTSFFLIFDKMGGSIKNC